MLTSASSLLRHSSAKVDLHIFHLSIGRRNEKLIKSILGQIDSSQKSCVELHHVKLDRFRSLKGLHGSLMPYYRLVLPEILNRYDRILYVDADTLFLGDPAPLADVPFLDNCLAAVDVGPAETSINAALFKRFEMPAGQYEFNSGVLLMSTGRWNRLGVTDGILKLIADNQNIIRGADQGAMNAYFLGQYIHMPVEYNYPLYPKSEIPQQHDIVLCHFVGSPKPWDIGGRFVHRCSDYYYKEERRIGTVRLRLRNQLTAANILRTFRIARSYYKAVTA